VTTYAFRVSECALPINSYQDRDSPSALKAGRIVIVWLMVYCVQDRSSISSVYNRDKKRELYPSSRSLCVLKENKQMVRLLFPAPKCGKEIYSLQQRKNFNSIIYYTREQPRHSAFCASQHSVEETRCTYKLCHATMNIEFG
jgi:hypothetical protein